MIKLKLKRSKIGSSYKQKGTLEALGLKKINQTVTHKPTPQILGMVEKVRHLIEVVEA